MKIISSRAHGYLDFLTVMIFLLAPSILGLSQIPALVAYSLAGVHLLVTLTSDFPFGVAKLIPFTVHDWIERMVGLLLIAIPFLLNFSSEEAARNFYIAMGIGAIAINMLTNYQGEVKHRMAMGK